MFWPRIQALGNSCSSEGEHPKELSGVIRRGTDMHERKATTTLVDDVPLVGDARGAP
jgi:hypothetical protein